MGKADMVDNNTLQHSEEALVVDELNGALGWTEDDNVGVNSGPHIVGEAHLAEAGDEFL